jgi:3-oxoacyl-[acyl-carrier protein] reductase
MSLAQWLTVLDVNLTGVFLCGREAAARMVRAGRGGVIVNISSIRFGIRTGSVAPGYVRTEILYAMRPDVLDGGLRI